MKHGTRREKRLRNRIIATAVLALLIILATTFAGILAPNDPYATSASSIRMAPGAQYPFGTDNLGRCVFSRVAILSTLLFLRLLRPFCWYSSRC